MNSITRKILLFYSRIFRKGLGHKTSFWVWYFKRNIKILYGIQKKEKRMIEDLNYAIFIHSKNKPMC